MKKKRIILLLVLGIPALVVLLIAGIVAGVLLSRPKKGFDYDDPEALWQLAERTERYIVQANPDKDSPARKEALQALEDIALLDVSDAEKARLIRERFPEESFWPDDMKALLKQAEAGDAEAQYRLGCKYSVKTHPIIGAVPADSGRVMKSEPMAAKWFRKAALQGHVKAQSRLVWSYEKRGHPAEKTTSSYLSDRVEKRIRQERHAWTAKAAAQGDADALLQVGGHEKYDAGARMIREAAEHGDVEAMLHMPTLSGTPDREEWYLKAAERGSVEGMVGYAQEKDDEDEEDDEDDPGIADQWWKKAFDTAMERLDEGSAEDLRLVLFYDLFVFLPQTGWERFFGEESTEKEDLAKRIMPKLWDAAERHGDYEAAPWIINRLEQQARKDKWTPSPELDIRTISPRLAELGIFLFQDYYAGLLADGKFRDCLPDEPAEDDPPDGRKPEYSGMTQDQAESFRLYRKLAGFGYATSQYELGLMYLNGSHGVPQDKAEAVKWLRKAAEQRIPDAMAELGDCLRSGDEPTSQSEARYWRIRFILYPQHDSLIEALPDIIHRMIMVFRFASSSSSWP